MNTHRVELTPEDRGLLVEALELLKKTHLDIHLRALAKDPDVAPIQQAMRRTRHITALLDQLRGPPGPTDR